MPNRDTAPAGAPCWVDLMTSDADAARAFYGGLFGWTSEQADAEYGGYITFAKDGVAVAGCMQNQPELGAPDGWSVYLASDDAKETEDRAAAHGGTITVPAMDVGDLGRMAVVTDAAGASVGIWQPGTHPGFQLMNEPGAPTWFEVHTRDYAATLDFYRTVFDWDVHVASDTPDFRYSTLGEEDGGLAGVMDASGFLPEGTPAHWSVYFGVADADAAVARVVELGGAVVRPPEDTPYGKLAQVTDTTGAMFKLVAG